MNKKYNKIGSFTLIELILVLILLGVIYSIFIPKFNIESNKNETKIQLNNLKQFLLENFEFEDRLKFSCIEKEFSCFVFVDNILVKDFKVLNFFSLKPEVYNYNKNLELYELTKITVDGFTENLIFELIIDIDLKSNEFILDTKDEKVFLFNSIFQKPLVFKTTYEVIEYFEKNINGVKSAF